jgi:hypothetical protein
MRALLLAFVLTFVLLVDNGNTQDNPSPPKPPESAAAPGTDAALLAAKLRKELEELQKQFEKQQKDAQHKEPEELQKQFEKLQKEAQQFDPGCMAKKVVTQWDGSPSRCLCRAICARAGLLTLDGEDKKWFTTCADFGFCSDVAPPTASTPSGEQLEFLPPELRELFKSSRKYVIG